MKVAAMSQDEIHRAIIAMCRYGGGFVSALGDAAVRADQDNLAKLKNAFPELFEEYAAFEWPNVPDEGYAA